MKETGLALTAIIAITILTAIGLWKGIDGTILLTSAATIAGLAGYSVKKIKEGP